MHIRAKAVPLGTLGLTVITGMPPRRSLDFVWSVVGDDRRRLDDGEFFHVAQVDELFDRCS